jgi:hypothetical protein
LEKKPVLISFYAFFFLPLFPSISRFKLHPKTYKHKKVDCDLYIALINHNSYSDFVFAYDAINNGREFCCFLSEGDAESDFNWFASFILFYFPSYLSHYFRPKGRESGLNDQKGN